MSRWNSKKMTVYIEDSGAGISERLGPGPGDFQVDGIEAGNYEAIETTDRGVHEGYVEGADKKQAWSLTIGFLKEAATHATLHRALDAIRKTGKWAGATSVDNDVWCFSLRVVFLDGGVTSQITLPKNRAGAAMASAMEGNTFSMSGTNVLAPVIT
jgi:hypothetical protein